MKNNQHGVSLTELMISLAIGLVLIASFLGVYLSQTQTYRTGVAQALIQNNENAIAGIISPIIRGAGFSGCSTTLQLLSNLNNGGPPPLGTINTTPAIITGYSALTSVVTHNAPNDTSAAHWSPALDSSLVGNVEAGSDVIIILSALPGSQPIGVTAIPSNNTSLTIKDASGVSVGQYGAISDCSKASAFVITSIAGNVINHAAGSGALTNASASLAITFPVGSQFIPLQQTALFVSQGPGGQSALMKGILVNGNWSIQALIPGIQVMKILYGVGSNVGSGLVKYVPANLVTNWSEIYAVRIAFLIEGATASGSMNSANPTQFTLLGNSITIPADNRLRHVYEITITLRNTVS